MLERIKSPNETVIWHSKTNRFLYTLGHPFYYIFALIWGGFDLLMFFLFSGGNATVTVNGVPDTSEQGFGTFIVVFFLFHSLPVWIAVIGPIFRFFSSKNIEYMMTDRRIYLVSGIFGKDVTNIEYREISNLTVNVSPLENMMKLGTIILKADGSSNRSGNGNSTFGRRLKHIENPYDVYNKIKELSLDVTTDQYYPNALRPDYNPGYQTKYKDS